MQRNKKKNKKTVLILLMLVCIAALAVSGTLLIRTLKMYKEGNDTYDAIVDNVKHPRTGAAVVYPSSSEQTDPSDESGQSTSGTETEEATEGFQEPTIAVDVKSPDNVIYQIVVVEDTNDHHILREPVLNGYSMSQLLVAHYDIDFDELRKINPDVVAWITIPGTPIDYPIVQGRDNTEYLTKTVDGKFNANGTIFLDYRCEEPFSYNTIIYGHNMRSTYMFHSLMYYYQDEEFLKAHPYIYILTPTERRIYCVYSTYQTDNVSYAFSQVNSPSQYEQYQQKSLEASIYDCGIHLDKTQDIITLATCTNDTDEHRNIVHAVCIANTPR